MKLNRQLGIRSIEQLPAYTETEYEILPLEHAGIVARFESVSVGQLRLHVETFASRLRFREVQSGNTLFLGLFLPDGAPVRFCAQRLDEPFLVAWHGIGSAEYEYVVEAGTTIYIVEVPEQSVQAQGWAPEPPAVLPLRPERVDRFRDRMKLMLGRSGNLPDKIGSHHASTLLAEIDALTDDALYATSGGSRPSKSDIAQQRIVAAVEAYLREAPHVGTITGAQLCSMLGISRRTMFSAFEKQLGVGPSKFQTLLRLCRLRAMLLEASPETDTVSRLVHEVGFTHLGRTSGLYRSHFNETPVKTLRLTEPSKKMSKRRTKAPWK